MRGACFHISGMGKMVQIRNMPEKLHRILKSRAAQTGLSLSDYLLGELRKSAGKPTEEELWERIRSREPATGISGAELVRQGREERERRVSEWVDRSAGRR